jgi:hypothetical protein
MRFTEDEDNMT